jgi:hypothetical protein
MARSNVAVSLDEGLLNRVFLSGAAVAGIRRTISSTKDAAIPHRYNSVPRRCRESGS